MSKKPSDANCAPRKKFKSSHAAHAAAVAQSRKTGKLRYPVTCSICNGWHLS